MTDYVTATLCFYILYNQRNPAAKSNGLLAIASGIGLTVINRILENLL
jgi:hypothetical protein